MDKKSWKKKIKKCCEEAGTYRPFFDPVIETLASILNKRDTAQEEFDKTGGKILVLHTNKGGATNIVQNPILRAINDLNRDALTYWKELGLTPSGLRKINESVMKSNEKKSALEEALMAMSK